MIRPSKEENTNKDRYNIHVHLIAFIHRSKPNNWSPAAGRISDRFDPVTITLL